MLRSSPLIFTQSTSLPSFSAFEKPSIMIQGMPQFVPTDFSCRTIILILVNMMFTSFFNSFSWNMQFRYFVLTYSSYMCLKSELLVGFIVVSMFLYDFVQANFLNYAEWYLKIQLTLLKSLSYLSLCPENLNQYFVWLGLTAFRVKICFISLYPATRTDLTVTLLRVSRPMERLTSLSACEYQTIRRLLSEKNPLRPGLPLESYTISEIARCFSYGFKFSSRSVSNLINFSYQISLNQCYQSKTADRNRSSINITKLKTLYDQLLQKRVLYCPSCIILLAAIKHFLYISNLGPDYSLLLTNFFKDF